MKQAVAATPPFIGQGAAAHQMVIDPDPATRLIAVTCICLRKAALPPIGVRHRWAGREAFDAWVAHLEAAPAR
jgi:hypothetical protein